MDVVDKILLCLSISVTYLTNTLREFLNKYFVFEISFIFIHEHKRIAKARKTYILASMQ